jgi:tetratricopeptide (TPR) repeat protein
MQKVNQSLIILLVISFMSQFILLAQPELPQLSPAATAYQKVGTTDVTIKYFRPGVKGREIWGGLVPYGQVWRTGANNATTIEFSTDVKLEGIEVKAGKYALFTIPNENEWTLILNSNADQWGGYSYEESKDVMRVTLKPENNQFHERLLFQFEFDTPNSSIVKLAWGALKVPFKIEAYLTDPESKDARPSPLSTVHQRIGLTDVTVTFGAPGVKGRTILGELVPFDKIWRAGANEATTIELSSDAKVNGNSVPAGKYAFFTIPTKEGEWTIILNKTAEQWGAYRYDESQDLLRFKVNSKESDHPHERLKFGFMEITGNSAVAALAWDKFMVPFTIEVETNAQALKNIETAVSEKPDDWAVYARSAGYAVENNVYLDKALEWVNKSLELNQHYWNNFLKANILYKTDDKAGAKESLAKAWELAKQDENTLKNASPSLKELEEKLK